MTIRAGAPSRELDATIAAYRLRFEVVRETVREGEGRRTVGFEVRLWATLPPGGAHLPDAPECRAAVLALLGVAEAVCSDPGQAADEIEPFRSALYDSRHDPGCDEIYLAIRPPPPYGSDPPEAAYEASLAALRRRLEALGVFEGHWRARLEEAGLARETPPETRAAGAAVERAAPAPSAPGRPAPSTAQGPPLGGALRPAAGR
jgi:hypothetical protein